MVIGVGTRYTDFTTASKWLFKDTCKFVNINVSEFQALKMDAVPVVADAKDALPACWRSCWTATRLPTPLRCPPPGEVGQGAGAPGPYHL